MSEILNLPKGHFILESSTTELPLQKAKFRIHKIHDSNKDRDYQLAFDANHKKVDFDSAIKKERSLFVKKYGKIHPTLYNLINGKNPPELVLVLVWLKSNYSEPKKTQLKTSELMADEVPQKISEERKKLREELKKTTTKFISLEGVKLVKQSGIAPAVVIKTSPKQIRIIEAYPEVVGLMLYETKGIPDLQDSLDISGAQQVVYVDGNKGKNIRVAVWEHNPDDESNLVIRERYNFYAPKSDHARLTTGIIKNKEKGMPHGYAPGCILYSANLHDNDALEWAVKDKLCRVINQSFHRDSEESGGDLSYDDILKDYLILHYPYPTIVQAAGNITHGETSSEFVNHKGYNSITVGNHNDSATAMSGDTTFRNPTTDHSDRELPEICANGTDVSAVGLTKGGTSFAAPAVAGSAAILMGINSSLKNWPEGVRAILLAGATTNVRGSNWRADMVNGVDARDGAGALDLIESAEIAHEKKNPGNVASMRGWDIGIFESSDFRSNGFASREYKIKVPKRGPTHVKVALTWDSQTLNMFYFPTLSILSVDLDLKIYKGSTLVAHSSSWDNSCEVAEYDAMPGDELTIKIKRYTGSDWTYYGLAWTVF